MTIRKASLLGSALALLVAPVRADETSVVVIPSFVSQYMLRGVRLGGPSFEPTVEIDSGDLVVGIWANTPLKDKVPGQSDPEIDPYGSYTFKLSDAVNIAPGFIWYTYPDAKTADGFYKSTFEPSIALNYTLRSGVRITPKAYCDLVLKSATYELTLACAIPLKDAGTELDWTLTGGTFIARDAIKGASPAFRNSGDYFLIGVSAPFVIPGTKGSKLIVGFAYTKGSGNYLRQGNSPRVRNTAAVGRGVVTLSYSQTF